MLIRGRILNDPTVAATGNKKLARFLAALCVIMLVAATYWPVVHAGFVWDDVIDFQNKAWLTQGNAWEHFIWRDFNNWVNYFRPLVIGLFTIQLRVFGVQPGPMHVVSLVIHLINTTLVGVLAWRLSAGKWVGERQWLVLAIPMLVYGLHPVLIEPVAWIGCQFDLVATLFMLLGLTLNITVRSAGGRAFWVAICFFLSVCSKESGAAFPLLLVVFDWIALDVSRDAPMSSQLKVLLRKNAYTYVAIAVAGVVYLALRHWALGGLTLHGDQDVLPAFARLQEASYLYLRYWGMIFWPNDGMSPVHPVPLQRFLVVNVQSVLEVVVTLAMVLGGLVCALKRLVIGGVVLIVTFSLLPVLHIVAASLDSSLYHERYAMTGLAMVCAMSPLAFRQLRNLRNFPRVVTLAASATLLFWISLSIIGIRMTLPLWSNQESLWQWALHEYPDDAVANAQLISVYADADDGARAWPLINSVVAKNVPCTYCMLNAAVLAVNERDIQRASFFLDRVEHAPDLHSLKMTYVAYLNARGALLLLQNNPVAAEAVAREAISQDGLYPDPQLILAAALARQGRVAEARGIGMAALQLIPPQQREQRRLMLERVLAYGDGSPSNERLSPSGAHP
jgi:hypothetical protein